MGRRISIPVRVVRPTEDRPEGNVPSRQVPQPAVDDRDRRPVVEPRSQGTGGKDPDRTAQAAPVAPVDAGAAAVAKQTGAAPMPGTADQAEEWRDRALRMQADMDNYRKRQQRWAQDQIEAERHRLLNAYLQVVDDLERALTAAGGDDAPPDHGTGVHPAGLGPAGLHGAGLRTGVELTHRAALQFLQKEGVEPIEARHQPFDPNWHEAVATTSRNGSGLPSGTIIEVLETGYRLDGRLLRPAKVVVAV
ncbi:MAG: nucleotide exchange factor GrpE [Anaerolineae bacterium]|jgi:molecular chaperone GrpE